MPLATMDQRILQKMKNLPEEYREEILDFVAFLSIKSKKNKKRIEKSMVDLRTGNITVIQNRKDIDKHIQGLNL
jgi:hypothetical protein